MKCYHHVDQKSSLKNQNPDQQSTYALQSIWEPKRTMSLNQVFPWVNLTNYQKKKQNKTGPLTRFNINQLPQKTVVTTLLCFITKVTVIVRDMTGL